jgi:hypothetical protein
MATKLKSKPNFRFKRYYKNFYKVQQKSEDIHRRYIGKLFVNTDYVYKFSYNYIQRCKYPLKELIEINEKSASVTCIGLGKYYYYYYWTKHSFGRRYYYRMYISVPIYFLNYTSVSKFNFKILWKFNKMKVYFNNFGF